MKFIRHLGMLAMIAALTTACQFEHAPARVTFDEAETAYRTGDYDKAELKYKEFLKQNPDPQLARLAERRRLSITREINNVKVKPGARPIYVSGKGPSALLPTLQPQIYQNNSPIVQPTKTKK